MFNRLKRLYEDNKITKQQLDNAVILNWITQDECDEIIQANGSIKE